MIVLDENIPDSEGELLQRKGHHVRQVGEDLGRKGSPDENVIVLLMEMHQPTFVTLDVDYYLAKLAHARYCLVWLDVTESRTAEFCLRFLRHPQFDTKAKRMGRVIRVAPSGISYWQVKLAKEIRLEWGK